MSYKYLYITLFIVLLGISNPEGFAQVSDYEPSEERSDFNNRKFPLWMGTGCELLIIIMDMRGVEIQVH
ncbi:MAG: hypothetical protein L7R84_05055 [Balneolaceae bacterium]|nr:hypothetical protein [Balneolaceae bacterium]